MLKPSAIRELFEITARTHLGNLPLNRKSNLGTTLPAEYEDVRTQREWVRFKRAAKVILDELAKEQVQYVIAKLNSESNYPKLYFSENPYIHRHTTAVENELGRLTKRHPKQSFIAFKIGAVAHGANSKLKGIEPEKFFAAEPVDPADQFKVFEQAITQNLVQFVNNTLDLQEARRTFNKHKADIVIKVTEPFGEYAENSYTLLKIVDNDRIFSSPEDFAKFVKLARGVARYTLWPDRYPLKEG